MGLARRELLEESGLDEPTLAGDYVTTAQADALWVAAFRRSGDPTLALRAAAHAPAGAYKVIDLIVRASPTIGEGLRRAGRYFPIVDERGAFEIAETRDEVAVRMLAPGLGTPPPDAAQHYTLACFLLRSREATGLDWSPRRATFTGVAPGDRSDFDRVFRCPLEFDGPDASLVLARSTWAQPNPAADHTLAGVLDEHAQMLLERRAPPVAAPLPDRVRALLSAELRGGEPTLERIAGQLDLAPRTVQRHLADANLSFADLLTEQRRSLAATYLADAEVSLAEVAFLLGFSEQSAFSRAYKRWTGVSPGAARKAMRA